MKSSKEYNQIQKSIHKILKDVSENKRRIEIGRRDMEEAKRLIPEKKASISFLKQKLMQLQEINKEYCQNNILKIKYAKQADKLSQLILTFQEDNKRYDNLNQNVADLPIEKEIEIKKKIDDVINQIQSEYTYNSDDYLLEQSHLNEINAALDSEIELLKLLKPDLVRFTDDFDIILDEFVDKYSPEDIQDFKSFKNIEIVPNDIQDIQIRGTKIDISYLSSSPASSMKGNIVSVIKDSKHKSNFILEEYQTQHRELSKIIEALQNRPIDLRNQAVIENYLQSRMQKMRAIGVIRPIQLPSKSTGKSTQLKPLIDVIAKFDSFIEDLKKSQENRHFNQQPQLEIPPYQIPNAPKCVRRSTPSNELIRFADDLESVIERAKQMIPIEWNNSITQNYRSLLNLKKYEIDTTSNSLNATSNIISEPKNEVENEVIEFDRSGFDRFKETFSRKLPQNMSNSLDIKRIALEVPDFEPPDLSNSTQDDDDYDFKLFDIPAESNQSFLNRVKTTNLILRELVNKKKTDVPQIQIPNPPEVDHPEIESKSLIEKVNEVLSPNQQTICYLKNEIANLNSRIEELSNRSIEKDVDDDVNDNSESPESIDSDINIYCNQLNLVNERCSQLEEQISEQSLKRDAIKRENDSLKQMIKSNGITPEMIKQMENEYQERSQKLQQLKDNWEESQELLRQLKAQT